MKTCEKETEVLKEPRQDERTLHLAAFEDETLSDEAVQQLAKLDKDKTKKPHKGRSLPKASRVDLVALAKAKAKARKS